MHEDKKVLLVVAAGKSKRFGGYPKAFCRVGSKTNIENTIEMASKHYDKVYVGVNTDTYERYKNEISECELFSIITGQGDAHSLLKCIEYVRTREKGIRDISVCWGDAVFVDDTPFTQFAIRATKSKAAVACARDKRPYAWFDLDENGTIIKTHFASDEGFVDEGMHDQSLFYFDVEYVCEYLNSYREHLGIPYDNDENMSDINEMKLLFSFEYLLEKGGGARCIEIEPSKVLSFNTQEEFTDIMNCIKIQE